MTLDEARAIWDRHRRRGEGWLDAMARLEREGYVLTVNEAMAADILWDGFVQAMQKMADTFAATKVSAG